MNKKGLNLGGLIVIFIGIMFVIALLPAIFESQSVMTTKLSVDNESTNIQAAGCLNATGVVNTSLSACNITAVHAPSGWKASDSECYLSGVVVYNDTSTLTEGTDYNLFDSTGIIQMLNTTETTNTSFGNVVFTNYTFCGDGYNSDAGSRGIAGLIGLFAAIALMIWVAYRSGILDNFIRR